MGYLSEHDNYAYYIGRWKYKFKFIIYNLSIKNSIFSDKFKLIIIKPLNKGDDRKNINNYRPISMLTNFSKIIKSRLISYLESNTFLSKNQ